MKDNELKAAATVLTDERVGKLWSDANVEAINQAGFGIGNCDVAHMLLPAIFARAIEREVIAHAGNAEAPAAAGIEGLTRYEPSDDGMLTNNVSGEYVEYREVERLLAHAGVTAEPAAPVQADWYKPLPTPEQLLAVARDTGLRSYLHGVNATEAREILSTYIDAVRLLDTGYLPAQVPAAEVRAQALPGWERGIATVTMNGHQLREALEFINPGGDDDADERDNDLTFGIVQHENDDGNAVTGLCCWNDDSDGVLPLSGEPSTADKASEVRAAEEGGAA